MGLQLGRRRPFLEDDKLVNCHLLNIYDVQSLLEIGDRTVKDKGYLQEHVKYFGELFFMRLKSEKSHLLQRSILNSEDVLTRLKVKTVWGKYVFLQLSLVEREAVEGGRLGESQEGCCPVGRWWEEQEEGVSPRSGDSPGEPGCNGRCSYTHVRVHVSMSACVRAVIVNRAQCLTSVFFSF